MQGVRGQTFTLQFALIFILGLVSGWFGNPELWKFELLGRITTRVLCRQSPLNLHQFCLTRDSKYQLVGTDWNAICQYFASIRLYLAFLFIMSMILQFG